MKLSQQILINDSDFNSTIIYLNLQLPSSIFASTNLSFLLRHGNLWPSSSGTGTGTGTNHHGM